MGVCDGAKMIHYRSAVTDSWPTHAVFCSDFPLLEVKAQARDGEVILAGGVSCTVERNDRELADVNLIQGGLWPSTVHATNLTKGG